MLKSLGKDNTNLVLTCVFQVWLGGRHYNTNKDALAVCQLCLRTVCTWRRPIFYILPHIKYSMHSLFYYGLYYKWTTYSILCWMSISQLILFWNPSTLLTNLPTRAPYPQLLPIDNNMKIVTSRTLLSLLLPPSTPNLWLCPTIKQLILYWIVIMATTTTRDPPTVLCLLS